MFPLDVGQSDRSYRFTHVKCRSTNRGRCFRGLVQWKIIRCYLFARWPKASVNDGKTTRTTRSDPSTLCHMTLDFAFVCVCVSCRVQLCCPPHLLLGFQSSWPTCCPSTCLHSCGSTPASWLPPIDLFQETLTAGRKREAEKIFFLPELFNFFSKLQ